jgi:hypothetical protein
MRYAYARVTRTQLGTIDNDAKSCFDRIVRNLAMLLSRHNGITKNICKIQSTTLQETQFKLRTALGGQGSCASPAIWLMLSSFLMKILKPQGHRMYMHNVENMINAHKIIDGFVDDNSIVTNEICNGLQLLFNKLQTNGKLWADSLEASGGKLELTKCFFYLLSWIWDTKGNPIADTLIKQKAKRNDNGLKLGCTNEPLRQISVETSHKTLGTKKCLVGEEIDHFLFLLDKSNNMAYITKCSNLNRQQARLAYGSCYISALLYSLSAVSLTIDQINKIQQKQVANT